MALLTIIQIIKLINVRIIIIDTKYNATRSASYYIFDLKNFAILIMITISLIMFSSGKRVRRIISVPDLLRYPAMILDPADFSIGTVLLVIFNLSISLSSDIKIPSVAI